MGKDDIWNGLALCRLHHWIFDTGWFTMQNDFTIIVSTKINALPSEFGRMGNDNILRIFSSRSSKILLPDREEIYPHQNAIGWHRENIFYR
jgi:putative restriction endonuclease